MSLPANGSWSVVIPAFNEALRLPPYLEEIIGYFEGRGLPYEVIVVDDGSRDGTAERVRETAGPAPVRVIPLAGNEGKGAAVRHGMLAAVGACRMFADADGATPISELKRLEAALAAGADVAIGSRVVRDPGVFDYSANSTRRVALAKQDDTQDDHGEASE